MVSRNSHLAAAIIGLESPLTYVDAYGNQGKVEQLMNLIAMEEAGPTEANRFFLDQMSPVCRDFLYKALSDLRGDVTQTAFFANGGGPFAATTGWSDGGTEAANNAFSVALEALTATITAGNEGALYASAALTTVIGILYEVEFVDLQVNHAVTAAVSNAAALTSPLASEALEDDGGEDEDGLYSSVKLRFRATATTTYAGLVGATTPASGVWFSTYAVRLNPVVE